MKKVKQTLLSSGLTVITVPVQSPSLTVLTLVGTGSKYEEKSNNGISHFLEHMCFKGTHMKTGKEISCFLDGLGAETNAFTGEELTGYYVKSITKHWKKTLAVVSDIYQNSTFPDTEIQKEKGVILGEISMYEDIPMRQVQEIFTALVYGDQPAGWSILGPRENIKKMLREDFIQYHEKHYVASATKIIIAGNIEHKDVVTETQKLFSKISIKKLSKKSKTIHTQDDIRINIQNKKTDQTHIILGYVSENMYHKDLAIIKLIAGILGGGMSSRLFEKLREDMGAGYYVRASQGSETDTGVLQISCGVESSRVAEVLTAIQVEIQRLIHEEITQGELKKAKEYITGNTFMGLEASDELAYYYGTRALFGLDLLSPKQALKKIQEVSSKDIMRVAQRIFKNERLNIAMIGPHKEEDKKNFIRAIKL